MTAALVNETSGKSTFSRLDTDSCRPSTRTRCFTTSPSRGPLHDDVVGVDVLAQPPPRRVAHPAVGGPRGEGDLAHEVRLGPPRVAGDVARHVTGERHPPAGREQVAEL